MKKVVDALNIILKTVNTLGEEKVKLTDSLGRVLREDIHSGYDVPGFDNSAMDGYAVRSSDTAGASKSEPRTLKVIEDLKAGYVAKKALKKKEAIRIMTGAPIPRGADSVVMVEDTEKKSKIQNPKSKKNPKSKIQNRTKELVRIFKEVNPGENIRKAGEDIKKGERILDKGTFLKSADIGILASLGISKVRVAKKPTVAILATGDEVVDVDKKLTAGKLYSSNTYALMSQVINCGAIPKNLGIAKDKPDELEAKIKQGINCDMLITSGGVSVGDYDFVKLVLAKMGTDIKFWKVAMRPGKPLVFGHIRGIPIFGLPGNPVSSMVSFEVFVRPAIQKMLGLKESGEDGVTAVLEEDIKKRKGIRYFLRAKTRWEDGAYRTRTTGPQGSGILKSMAIANSLIILPEEKENMEKGEKVTVRFLD